MSAGSRTETWTRMNHLFTGQSVNGYAVCDNCGAKENRYDICLPCPGGPVLEALDKEIKAAKAAGDEP